MDDKVGLVSRHVVVPKYSPGREHLPIFALVLMDSGMITDVIKLPEATEVDSLPQLYPDYSILDFQHSHITPGLIDCNVRVNSDWETLSEVSHAAVAGGVTFLLAEDSIYRHEAAGGECFCDVGRVKTLTKLSAAETEDSVFAWKVYRYPPSAWQDKFEESFEALFLKAAEERVPVFVDNSLPEERMLMMGSPYRHCRLEERATGKPIDEASFNPGAFQDESKTGHSSSESEGDNWELLKPDRTQSSLAGFRLPKESPALVSPLKLEDKSSMWKDLEQLPSKPAAVKPTLIENLNTRIRYHRNSVESLSLAELKKYDSAGEYVFSTEQPAPDTVEAVHNKRSLSSVSEVVEPLSGTCNELNTPKTAEETLTFGARRRRPPQLTVTMPTPTYSKDRDYLTHLANLPEHWESNALPRIFKALSQHPCKVLFTNMSAATAVNEVRQFKEKEKLEVSVETCPHYLFFCMEEIEAGDTKLKTFPPIRNKTNCNLLWELLKVKCIDLISSHHASVPTHLKFLDAGSFKRAVSGINGIGCSLSAVWTKLRMPAVDSEAVRERYIVRLAKWMSHAPARLLGIANKRGSIERGKFADIVVWQPNVPFDVDRRWTKFPELNPYRGKRMYGHIQCVFVRGQLAFEEGEVRSVGRLCMRSELV